MSPPFVRGKAIRQAAAASARRWQRLSFADLCRSLDGGLEGRLVLPVAVKGLTETNSPPCITMGLNTNHPAIATRLLETLGDFWHPGESYDAPLPSGNPPLMSRDVCLYVGKPQRLGLPDAVEVEKANWSEAVMRGEAYAYHRALDDMAPPDAAAGVSSASPAALSPPSPVRWLTQQLLDGFVSCRVDAHAGVTTASMLHTRETAKSLAQHLPPFDVSPYYGASELLDRWCLFGDAEQMLHSNAPGGGPRDHTQRVLELALGSALLPFQAGTWLNASVVVHRRTGDAAVILGPPHSGKTTLALHCLNASEQLDLVASERVFLCNGTQLPGVLGQCSADDPEGQGPRVLLAGVPGSLGVGVGALLGTLLPNPLLSSCLVGPLPTFMGSQSATRQLLQNSDGVLWDMAAKYPVNLNHVGGDASHKPRWCPATLSRIRCLVLLDWSPEELRSTAPSRSQTVARRLPPVEAVDIWERHIDPLLDSWGTVRDHYLLRSVYSSPDAPPLSQLLAPFLDSEATVVSHVVGAVDFALTVKVIKNALRA